MFFLRPKVGDNIVVQVESTHELKDLNVAVLNRYGVAYTKNIEEADDEKKLNFTIEVTKEMQPAANLIVYYVNDGKFVMGHQKITPEINFDNHVSKCFSQ